MRQMETSSHWKCHRDIDPDNHIGFVYEIHNLKDDRRYIGKKNFWFKNTRKKSIVKDMNNPKFKKEDWKESDWKTYKSSCKPLKADIDKHGMDNFKFTILSQWKATNTMRFVEARLQWGRRVLESNYYYNNSIGEIRFPMPQELKDGYMGELPHSIEKLAGNIIYDENWVPPVQLELDLEEQSDALLGEEDEHDDKRSDSETE